MRDMAGIREAQRAEMTARILQSAHRQIAEHGTLAMRAVARDVGLVSSAVFRYYPTRESLLTAMIIESYEGLANVVGDAVAGASGADAERWSAGVGALRGWAIEKPHEFQLIYGTPIPGYQAPPETIPAAAAAAAPLLDLCTDQEQGIAELAQVIGFVGLELARHFVGAVADPDALFASMTRRQAATLFDT